MVALALAQFFVGGFVLYLAQIALILISPSSEYDGVTAFVAATLIAVISMISAMVIGLPLRLVPALRSHWLANGEITVAGAVFALVVTVVLVNGASVEAAPAGGWALLAAWALFALSVAHFVWPARWMPSRTKAPVGS